MSLLTSLSLLHHSAGAPLLGLRQAHFGSRGRPRRTPCRVRSRRTVRTERRDVHVAHERGSRRTVWTGRRDVARERDDVTSSPVGVACGCALRFTVAFGFAAFVSPAPSLTSGSGAAAGGLRRRSARTAMHRLVRVRVFILKPKRTQRPLSTALLPRWHERRRARCIARTLTQTSVDLCHRPRGIEREGCDHNA